MSDTKTRASEITEQKRASRSWLEANYYSQFERAWKNYKAEPDPELGPDKKPDTTLTSVGIPDTNAYVNRLVARITASIPNIRFHARDKDLAELISRTLMMQWDKGKVQRLQKKHARQMAIFGWSVRPWYWSVENYDRSKRVNPLDPKVLGDPNQLAQICATYNIPVKYVQEDPDLAVRIMTRLLAKHSRGGMLPIQYSYRGFEGPKADWLFIGDCYPETNFTDIQSSNYFIVDRRRNWEWFKDLLRLFPGNKTLINGLNEVVQKYPKGTYFKSQSQDTQTLRNRMLSVINRTDEYEQDQADKGPGEWTVSERHIPGPRPRVAYVVEESIFLGEFDYPYDLMGKIAFTEGVLTEDLLSGIGDSTARIMRGLHLVHERQVSRRADLINNILRPLVGTSNRELYENPGMVKRYGGFRLVYMRGQGDMWVQPEQAAMASAAASLNDEQSLYRMMQLATGDSNMSMGVNVDPTQNRTATGAKITQQNMDVLTKDLNDMFAISSLSADGEMMYLLNRSELSEGIEFEASNYNRVYAAQEDAWKEQWVRIEPEHFQTDGEIIAEPGSTMADDDDAKVQKATMLYQAALATPQLWNLEKARDEFLIAHGKGRELAQWKAKPQPPPHEVKASATISFKGETFTDAERMVILSKVGIIDPGEAPALVAQAQQQQPPPEQMQQQAPAAPPEAA